MEDFSSWAGRKIRASQYRKKKQAEAAARMAENAPEPVGGVLSAAQKWALQNPEMAKYDNDGNPVTFDHWAGKDI
jgi:hypothetical protein